MFVKQTKNLRNMTRWHIITPLPVFFRLKLLARKAVKGASEAVWTAGIVSNRLPFRSILIRGNDKKFLGARFLIVN